MANYVLDHTGQQVNTKLTKAENTDNKVTSISSSSTNTQYPSAKLLYDQLQLKQNSSSAFSGNYNDLTNRPVIPDVGNAKIYYGTCTTAADVAEKQVVCAAYTATGNPTKGDIIYVTFSYTNSVAPGTAKLKVGNSTAKVIRYQGTTSVTNLPGASYLIANNTYRFTYNGTYWVVMLNYNSNTNTLQRTFLSDTNIELPLMGANGTGSATATVPAFTSGTDPNFYTDSYGAVPATGNLRATINLSTGAITAPGGFVGNLTGSATLSGTPTAPTATAGTNTTQIATTAFVQNAISGASSNVNIIVLDDSANGSFSSAITRMSDRDGENLGYNNIGVSQTILDYFDNGEETYILNHIDLTKINILKIVDSNKIFISSAALIYVFNNVIQQVIFPFTVEYGGKIGYSAELILTNNNNLYPFLQIHYVDPRSWDSLYNGPM